MQNRQYKAALRALEQSATELQEEAFTKGVNKMAERLKEHLAGTMIAHPHLGLMEAIEFIRKEVLSPQLDLPLGG